MSYEPSDKWHLRLSGVFRGLEYEVADNADEWARSVAFGWGVKLTGHYDFYPVKGYWMIQTGKGCASFQSGNKEKGLDLVPDTNGKMTTPLGLGATMGLQINWLPNLFSVFKGSYLHNYIPPFDDANHIYEQSNQRMANANVNLLFDAHKLVRIGVEYSFWYNQTVTKQSYMAHSALAMMYVSF